MIILLMILCIQQRTVSAEHFGRYDSHQVIDKSIIITSNLGHRMRITPYGSSIVRLQAVRKNEDFYPDHHYEMVESHGWPGVLSIQSDSSELILSFNNEDDHRIRIDKKSMGMSLIDESEHKRILTHAGGIWWNDDTVGVSFLYDEAEHFAGLGHGYFGRENSIDLKGKVVRRNYGTQHGEQAPLIVPFYLSNNGYGVFLNSTFPNEFRFGWQNNYEFRLTGSARMDYFIILGPHLKDIIDRYTQLTGRPRLFPRAALGLALSDKGNDHLSSAPSDEQWWRKKISAHRKAGFPLDHVVNDNRWRAGGGERCRSRFDWDLTRYPNPKKYGEWIQSQGLIITLDFNRCIASHSDGWLPAFNIQNPEGIDFNDSAPDLTKPEVREWFWNIFWNKSLDTSLHYPGNALWIDEFDEMGKAPLTMKLGDGREWMEVRNYWFFLIAKALVHDGWDKSFKGDRRPFVWVRGMTAGAQRYATLWSGDIKPTYGDMKTQVRSLQLAGLAGFPMWGHDAGGFNNWEEKKGPDDVMYRQWSMAFGSFTPFWKPHGMGQSRWPLDRPKIVQKDSRTYAELRYKLIPYIYSYAHQSSANGMPIARAMIIDHQNDPRAWSNDLQYMWGNEMLVAPNCSDSDSVTIWLPDGNWYDFWSDDKLQGNREFSYPSPTGKLPLFIKEGAVIPMANFALSTAFIKNDSLTIHVYTGADGSFVLYEDDGISERYRTHNEQRRTEINYQQTEGRLTILLSSGTYSNAPSHRAIRIEFHGIQSPSCIEFNGKEMKNYRSLKSAMKAKEGVVWDKKKNIATVFLKSHPVDQKMILTTIKDCR